MSKILGSYMLVFTQCTIVMALWHFLFVIFWDSDIFSSSSFRFSSLNPLRYLIISDVDDFDDLHFFFLSSV